MVIVKYGKVFSALQFLPSTDREHYASGLELALRYLVFHFSFTAMIAFVQYPFWMLVERWDQARKSSAPLSRPKTKHEVPAIV